MNRTHIKIQKNVVVCKKQCTYKKTKQNTIINVAVWKIKNKTRHAKNQCDWSKSITQNTKIQKIKMKIYI